MFTSDPGCSFGFPQCLLGPNVIKPGFYLHLVHKCLVGGLGRLEFGFRFLKLGGSNGTIAAQSPVALHIGLLQAIVGIRRDQPFPIRPQGAMLEEVVDL